MSTETTSEQHPLKLLQAFRKASSMAVLEFTRARNKKERLQYVVLHQCVVAQNTFQSIATMLDSAAANPEIGFGLCRTLLELACGAIHLVKHPSELDDFLLFGELKRLSLEEAFGIKPSVNDSTRLRNLQDRFRQKGKGRITTWHCQASKDFILNAGFGRGFRALYDEASSILHGDALGTVEYALEESGDLFRAPALLRRWPAAIRISTQIQEHLLAFVDEKFDLRVKSLADVKAAGASIRLALPSGLLDPKH